MVNSTIVEAAAKVGQNLVVDFSNGMEIEQIPHFARMIDGRNRTSVIVPRMVNGKMMEEEDQEVSLI